MEPLITSVHMKLVDLKLLHLKLDYIGPIHIQSGFRLPRALQSGLEPGTTKHPKTPLICHTLEHLKTFQNTSEHLRAPQNTLRDAG